MDGFENGDKEGHFCIRKLGGIDPIVPFESPTRVLKHVFDNGDVVTPSGKRLFLAINMFVFRYSAIMLLVAIAFKPL